MPKSRKVNAGRLYHKSHVDRRTGERVFQSTWTIRFKGRDYSTGTDDRREAEFQLLKKASESAREQRLGGSGRSVLVSDILSLVIEDYRRQGKANIKSLSAHVALHLNPHLGKKTAAGVTKDDIEEYKDTRVKEKAALATINRELAALRRGFSLAIETGSLSGTPPIQKFRENNIRTGFLTSAQYETLMSELPDYLKPLCCVGYHVGCRAGELFTMERRQVDLGEGEIRLDPGTTKNRQGRTAPIYGSMAELLGEWIEQSLRLYPQCTYLFHRNGKRFWEKSFRSAWDAACERAGMPELLFHDLRRSAVRNMTRAGVPRIIARQITGHKTDSVYDRYDIVDSSDIKLAGAMLNRFATKG